MRDIRIEDIRRIVDSGLEEHLQLEYKSELYDDSERGRKEFLLDVCMFANTAGGILLLGVPERRDEQGQPTGVPDPEGALGIASPNPEATLAGYDARIMEAIEERLPMESAAIDAGDGRRVFALRVPSSTNKPHSVRHQGHIYFPARRERQRYPMNVREIKEMAMRTASRLERAEQQLSGALLETAKLGDVPYLAFGMMPVFSEDFQVDLRDQGVYDALGRFNRTGRQEHRNPKYTFEGLQRCGGPFEHTVTFRRNGLLCASMQLPLMRQPEGTEPEHVVDIRAFDVLLRAFMVRARELYEAAGVGSPFLLSMLLRVPKPLAGACPSFDAFSYYTDSTPARDYNFPYTHLTALSNTDPVIRPLCDLAHQMFGREGSPCFDAQGVWIPGSV